MKKLVILLVLMLACGTVYAEPGEKISVLMVSDRSFNQNAEMLELIQKATDAKFSRLRYDTKIYGKDSSPAISEFMERYIKDGNMVMKANSILYGKEVGADKIIVLRFIPVESMQWYNGAGGTWIRCKVELTIKGFSVANEKYIVDQAFTTKDKARAQKGLEDALVELQKWQIPVELR